MNQVFGKVLKMRGFVSNHGIITLKKESPFTMDDVRRYANSRYGSKKRLHNERTGKLEAVNSHSILGQDRFIYFSFYGDKSFSTMTFTDDEIVVSVSDDHLPILVWLLTGEEDGDMTNFNYVFEIPENVSKHLSTSTIDLILKEELSIIPSYVSERSYSISL